MWFLILFVPVTVILMGVVSRLRPMTETDRICSAIDVRLDRAQDRFAAEAPIEPAWIPQPRRVSRVAPRPSVLGGELLAS